MKSFIQRLLWLLGLCGGLAGTAHAQSLPPTFTAIYEGSLSAAAGVATLQQPASPTKTITLLSLQLYCSVACTITLDAGGAASGSTTAVRPTSPSQSEAATARWYSDSNASAASVAIAKYYLAAGETRKVEIAGNMILAKAPSQNFTLRSNAITGTANYLALYREDY